MWAPYWPHELCYLGCPRLCPIIESTQSHIIWYSEVTVHKTVSFLPNTHNRYTFAHSWERNMWGKIWVQIMNYMFLIHRSIVFSIVLDWAVLPIRHNYKSIWQTNVDCVSKYTYGFVLFVLFWLYYLIWGTWYIYPYSSGLLHWCWGPLTTTPSASYYNMAS